MCVTQGELRAHVIRPMYHVSPICDVWVTGGLVILVETKCWVVYVLWKFSGKCFGWVETVKWKEIAIAGAIFPADPSINSTQERNKSEEPAGVWVTWIKWKQSRCRLVNAAVSGHGEHLEGNLNETWTCWMFVHSNVGILNHHWCHFRILFFRFKVLMRLGPGLEWIIGWWPVRDL